MQDKHPNEIKEVQYIENVRADTGFKVAYAQAFLAMIQWARILTILKATYVIGPMVEMIMNMFMDIIKFIVLYVLVFLVFMSAGDLLFYELKEYKNISTAA